MAVEIERKFLVKDDSWKVQADQGARYRQGYIVGSKQASVRVRLQGDKAFLNIKSATLGIYRQEFEYEIPVDDANELLETLCEKPLISKIRYHLKHANHIWEVDVFEGDNSGLVVAEIELANENEAFEIPAWAGKDVSNDTKYYNSCLVKYPYKNWNK